MNEKIKELAEKAGLYDFMLTTMGIDGEIEKLAELIILECHQRANKYIDDCGEVSSLPEYVLEEHFGIKL